MSGPGMGFTGPIIGGGALSGIPQQNVPTLPPSMQPMMQPNTQFPLNPAGQTPNGIMWMNPQGVPSQHLFGMGGTNQPMNQPTAPVGPVAPRFPVPPPAQHLYGPMSLTANPGGVPGNNLMANPRATLGNPNGNPSR